MESDFVCLGLEFLGECSYNPADPESYFTLGHLLSVLALILTFTQLTKPVIEFRINSINFGYRKLLILISVIIAIISIFIATVLPFIPGVAQPLIGYPIFWELLSAILILFAGLFLISIISKPAKFTPNNAEQYLNATVLLIAKGDEQLLNALAQEIYHSIPSIINLAKNYNFSRALDAKIKNEVYEIESTTNIALHILDVWSDKLFCKSLVCKSPDSAAEIIIHLSKYPNLDIGFALSNEIINQCFENDNSILNRESSYSGLGFFKNFINLCFGNWEFVEGMHRPLQSWQFYKNQLTSHKVEKFCECVNIAFKAYIDSKNYYQKPFSLNNALDTMSSIALSQVIIINRIPKQELHGAENQKIIEELWSGYTRIIDTVLKKNDYPETQFSEITYDSFKDSSIYGTIAEGVYKYFEILAMIKGHDDFIRRYAIGIWLDIFGVPSSEVSRNQDEIGKRLLFHIKNKVDHNLDHEKRGYPAITKILLLLHGINEADFKDDVSLSAMFQNQFLTLLKDRFQLLYQAEEEFAQNMLPDSIKYDPDSNKLIDIRSRRKTTQLILNSSSEIS